jgi:hypothetical protein
MHPRLPQFNTSVRAEGHRGHAFVVPHQEDQPWVRSQEVHDASGVRPSVDGVPQDHHTVLCTKVQAMQQGPKRGKVAMHVANRIDAVAVIETCLKVRLKGSVSVRWRGRKHLLARQGESPRRCFAPLHPSS